ncbi:hypothetical protein KIM67_17075 [Flagellimonas sp. 389]|nr:hypothetical protein [Flagellimonas sp. 389]MBS9464138.1 hypothetical protein [Flagellimonas sp. 389]
MQSGPTFNPAARNPLRDTDYSSIGDDRFLFQITDIDFDSAEDCDDECL